MDDEMTSAESMAESANPEDRGLLGYEPPEWRDARGDHSGPVRMLWLGDHKQLDAVERSR